MGFVNLPPSLQVIFSDLDSRLTKVENAQRFTMPNCPVLTSQPTITGLTSGDPSNPRVGDIWLNTTSNTPKYVNTTGAVSSLGGFTGGTLTSDLILAPGSTSVEPITFQSNVSTPTATSGAMDYDGDKFYATTSGTATGRLMMPVMAMAYSNANATSATTSLTPQSIFQATARSINLEAGKTYYFKLSLGFSITFPAGAPFAVTLVPTFTNAPVDMNYTAQHFGANSVNNFRITSSAASTVTGSFTGSAGNQNILIEGFFRSNATTGGSLEFKYALSVISPGGSAQMTTGCYQQLMKIGSGAPGVIAGSWT